MKGASKSLRAAFAAVAAAAALCAFAANAEAKARAAEREAARIRGEMRSGPLADELAAEARWRAALDGIAAAAAAVAQDAPPPRGAARKVRGTPLSVWENEETFPAASADAVAAAVADAVADGATRFRRIAIDALPGGKFRASGTTARFRKSDN